MTIEEWQDISSGTACGNCVIAWHIMSEFEINHVLFDLIYAAFVRNILTFIYIATTDNDTENIPLH